MVPQTNHDARTLFEAFFERWLVGHEHYLHELLRLIERNDDDTTTSSSTDDHEESEAQKKNLINQVIAHYTEYYEAKARVVRQDVFLTLTPPWFSSFERAYFWIGGFRTGIAFRLVTNYVLDLTEHQTGRINALMAEIKEEEQGLTDELTRLQEGMASAAMLVVLARPPGRLRNGQVAETESAFERLRRSMEDLVQSADFLRRKTIINLMEMLRPSQMVRFLAALIQLQLRLRSLGMHREARIQRENTRTHN